MILFQRSNYFYGGSVALFISWTIAVVLTGCRFGNHVESPDNPDKISGYYDTQPQSLKFCATYQGSTQCADMVTNFVPAFVADKMTNPTALIIRDLDSGAAVLTSPTGGTSALPIRYNSDKSLSLIGQYPPQILFRDPACTSITFLEEEGAIVAGPANSVAGSTRLTSGRIQLKIQVIEEFDEKTCGPTLQDISDCYQNATLCGESSPQENAQVQGLIQTMFNPYINANAMSANDIPNLTNISYMVQYE